MNAQLPESIEADAEDLVHGTHLTVREGIVLLCDRDGLANESIRAYLGKTDSLGEVTVDEIRRILGTSESRVESIRSDIRAKARELRDEQDKIERTLEVIEGDGNE